MHPPILNQKQPYKYLDIHIIPSLDWRIQTHITSTKLQEQCKLLQARATTMKQKMHMTDFVIRVGKAYAFYVVPFSAPTIRKLDKHIITLYKNKWPTQKYTKSHHPTTTYPIRTRGILPIQCLPKMH